MFVNACVCLCVCVFVCVCVCVWVGWWWGGAGFWGAGRGWRGRMDDATGGLLAGPVVFLVGDSEEEGRVEAAVGRSCLEREAPSAEARLEDPAAEDPAGRRAADDGCNVRAGEDLEQEIGQQGL